jgi:hypothetical protein
MAKTQATAEKVNGEAIYSYEDGSVYMGMMQNGLKHGSGTLRTAAFIYGAMGPISSAEAEDNMHLVKWHEYTGEWQNDVMHGTGLHVMMHGDGSKTILFDGVWTNGIKVEEVPSYE